MSEACARMDAWLTQPSAAGEPPLPPDDLVDHVTNCSRCRGTLLVLVTDQFGVSLTPSDASCATVEEQLPAFVDYEQFHGLATAARAFPDVWWHTLVCPACDELYRALLVLAELPAQPPMLVSQPSPVPFRLGIRATLQIHGDVLRQFLGLGRALGPAWGQQDDMVIAERQDEIGVIQVFLRRDPPNGVALVVRTRPPFEGVVTLTLADEQRRAMLDVEGCAVFGGIAEERLSLTADELTLKLEPTGT